MAQIDTLLEGKTMVCPVKGITIRDIMLPFCLTPMATKTHDFQVLKRRRLPFVLRLHLIAGLLNGERAHPS